MQVRTVVPANETNRWASMGLAAGIFLCTFLFGLVVVRLGLLNGLMGEERPLPVAGEHSLVVTTQAMRFGQEVIRLQAGQEVTLYLDNDDVYAHSFDVDELGVHVEMPANSRVVTLLAPAQAGTYTIYCAVPGHKNAGMMAKLIVEP